MVKAPTSGIFLAQQRRRQKLRDLFDSLDKFQEPLCVTRERANTAGYIAYKTLHYHIREQTQKPRLLQKLTKHIHTNSLKPESRTSKIHFYNFVLHSKSYILVPILEHV